MSQTQQQLLEEEFPQAMLGTVSKGGSRLTYVPVGEVIQRLNDVLGPSAWSWRVEKVWRDEVSPEWVIATGNLTCEVDGVVSSKSGEGGVKVKVTRNGDLVDLGDEFKGAASDALKKAAQKFGVALYLSRKDEARRYERPEDVRDPVAEGYESNEEAIRLTKSFAATIKAAHDDVAAKVREERDRLGVIWPPTKDEFDALVKFVADTDPATSQALSEALQKPETAPQPAGRPDAPSGGTTGTTAVPNAPAASAGIGGGWATPEERDAAHEAVYAKAEQLSDEAYEKVTQWATSNSIDFPTSKTNLLRYEAFIDAIAAPID